MRNTEFNRSGHARAALGVLLLLGLTAQPAAAQSNSQYDSASLNGNLQDQCKNFSAAVVRGTSHKVSAECNKEGDTTGSVAASLQSTALDLRDEVVWNTTDQTFTWDGTRDDNNDLSDKCPTVRGFSFSATDVTLQLTCTVDSTDGSVQTVNANLPLNGKVTVGTDGNLTRR